MARAPYVPLTLQEGPFHARDVAAHGLSRRQLNGRAWSRIFPGVWQWSELPMTWERWLAAARLCLPDDAWPTAQTRIAELGLQVAEPYPLHFVIARDHHVVPHPKLVLHRTAELPPTTSDGLTGASAFIAFAAQATFEDIVVAGDWLLTHGHLTILGLREQVSLQPWRAGAAQAMIASRHLASPVLSPEESRLRVRVVASGLPEPEVNADVWAGGERLACVDLWIPELHTAIEYEGAQHQTDRAQYLHDIGRYERLRQAGIAYVQVTRELARNPIACVRHIHRALVAHGYSGPPPRFGEQWARLFQPIRAERWMPHASRRG